MRLLEFPTTKCLLPPAFTHAIKTCVTLPRALIAVLDDEECVRRAMRRLIVSAGLDVAVFETGEALLEGVASRRPDCVVLDLHMPGMSGFDIQSRLTQGGHDIPVVVITGHDTSESRSLALAGGAAAYLRKPVKGNELLESVLAAIEHRGPTRS